MLFVTYGFGYIFDNAHNVNMNAFKVIFKQRVTDNFIQQWHVSVGESSVLSHYKFFKVDFANEPYLDILPYSYRCLFSRIRLSSHSLRIVTGRFSQNRLNRNERICLYCNSGDIDDEFHFICICSCFIEKRKRYIKKYYYHRPSMFKFVEFLKSLIEMS